MRKELLLGISIILVSIIFYPTKQVISNSTGSGGGGGNTNSPIDGQNCTACHSGTVSSSDSSQFSYNIMPVVFDPISNQWDGVYTPGVTYTFTYLITDNSSISNKYGFELTAEADAANQKTGAFFITNSAETQLTNLGTAVTHTAGGTSTTTNLKQWTVDWQAPSAGTGDVTMYVSSLAANSNGNNNGDNIFASSYSFQEAVALPVLTFDNITPTDPLCNDDWTGNVILDINQTVPVTDVQVIWYYQNPSTGFWVQLGQSNGANVQFLAPQLGGGLNLRFILFDFTSGSTGAPLDTAYQILGNPPALVFGGTVTGNSINTSTSGGTPVYTYSWTGPNGFTAVTEDINNLSPGNYTVTVTDSNGCDDDSTFTILPPTASWDCNGQGTCIDPGTGTGQYSSLSACQANCCDPGVISDTNVTCYFDFDGIINISNVSGTAPYTISIRDTNPPPNSGSLDTTFTSSSSNYNFVGGTGINFDYTIGQGVYEYIFTDNTGCSDTNYISVGRDGVPFVVDTIISPVSDTINPNGAFTINVNLGSGYPNGANPPYNYVWYNSLGNVLPNQSSNTLSPIDTGVYSVVITDNGPHVCSSDSIILQMSLAPPCWTDSSLVHNICPGVSEGQVILSLGSGWSGSQFFDSSSTNSIGLPNLDTIGGLSAGIYNVILTPDGASSCITDTIVVEILEPVIASIDLLGAVSGNYLCAGDSSRILVEVLNIDTNMYSYGYRVAQNGASFLGYSIDDTSSYYYQSGSYTLVLNYFPDSSCTNKVGYNALAFSINEFNLDINAVTVTDVVCGVSLGEINIELDITAENTPFTYSINNYPNNILVDNFITNNFTHTFLNLPEDTLFISVDDNLGCSVEWFTPVVVGVFVPTTLAITTNKETCRENDGYLQVIPTNGQGLYDFILKDSTNNNIITTVLNEDTFQIKTLNQGTYFLSVIDDSLCVKDTVIFIEHVAPFEIASLTKTSETCCGYDGAIDVNINPGDGVALLYTLRFDTSAINAFGLTIWPDSLYIDTFNVEQYSPLFPDLTRGHYHVFVEDEFGCIDSVDYVSYQQGTSSINSYLGIDATMQLDMDFSYTDVKCYGDTNATIKLLYPNACYNYELWLYHDTTSAELIGTDSIRVSDTLVYYDELYAGIYGIQGVSNSGYAACVRRSDTFQIIEPTIVSYDAPLSTAAFCLNGGFEIDGGACNGTVWLPNSPTGGVTDTSIIQSDTLYQYYINRVNSSTNYYQGAILTDSAFTGLCPGEYEVQVFDGNNCMIKDTVMVADSSLYIDSLITTNISCFDSSDATITVYAHGGVGDYNFVWQDSTALILSDTTQTIDSLLEGEYTVTTFDSVGCYAIASENIATAPDSLMLISRRDEFDLDETCLGYTYDGRVGFEIRGGTEPYAFNWVEANGLSDLTIAYAEYCDTCTSYQFDDNSIDSIYMLDSLTAGTYNVSLTDDKGCTSFTWLPIDSVRIIAANRNNPLSIDSIVGWEDILCFGANNDSLIFYLNPSAMPPLIFELDSSSAPNDSLVNYTGIYINLSANEYDVLITDSFGCFIEDKFTITEHSEIIVDYQVTDLSCYESADGSISLTVSGGTSNYSFQWDNTVALPTGATTQDINNLIVGTYGVTVSDDANCFSAVDSIYVGQPDPLQSTVIDANDALCHGSSDAGGSIAVIGGTSPYSYSWTDINNTVISSLDSVLSDVIAGVYLCVITDNLGCEDTIILTLQEPEELVLEVVDITDNLCYGDTAGIITVIVSGGTPPYSDYTIEGSNGPLPPQASNIFTNLPEAQPFYTIWAIDAHDCPSSVADSIKVGAPGLINLEDIITNLSCYESDDGSIELIVSGGVSPFNYQLIYDGSVYDNGIVFQLGDTLKTYDLITGSYSFAIEDYHGCKDSIEMMTITQPEEVVADFLTSADLILKGERVTVTNLSLGANMYIWNFGDNSTDIEAVEPNHKYTQQGTFQIILVASNSGLSPLCNDTFSIPINVEGYDVNNVFTPNGDGVNDVYQFTDEMLLTLYVNIYNRWGQQVYGFDDVNGVWDGTGYNGELLPEGVYFFTMEATGELGTSYTEEGSITLIR